MDVKLQPNRSVCFDTETTGLDPKNGHKLIELGAVELINGIRSGRVYHTLLDPRRPIDPEAQKIHGKSAEMLAGQPVFADVADDFLEFIGQDTLIIHNASFDLKFVNAELGGIGRPPLTNRVVDTMLIARKKFPNASARLDALCQRFKIDNSHRTLHGALLDADLLAQVYLHLCGGPQNSLVLSSDRQAAREVVRKVREPRPAQFVPSHEIERHRAFLERTGIRSWLAQEPEGLKMPG